MYGRIIKKASMDKQSHQLDINTQSFVNGVYILKMQTASGQTSSQSFVISR